MLDKLGVAGVVGFVVMLAGLVLVAYQSPVVALGLALMLAGLGIVVKALVGNVLRQFGMA